MIILVREIKSEKDKIIATAQTANTEFLKSHPFIELFFFEKASGFVMFPNVKYSDEVMVFTMQKGGLMHEASIGGQKFSFSKL